MAELPYQDEANSGEISEKQAAERNAVAWLLLTPPELAERSGSLGLQGNLATYNADPVSGDDAVMANDVQIAALRKNADAVAVKLAGKRFVSAWIKENR